MSAGFWTTRSKSDSNILEVCPSESCEINSRNCTYERCRNSSKKSEANEIIRGYEKELDSSFKSPSQNFVKKLVASLERRNSINVDYRANDEFFAKYSRPEMQSQNREDKDSQGVTESVGPKLRVNNGSTVKSVPTVQCCKRILTGNDRPTRNFSTISSFHHTRMYDHRDPRYSTYSGIKVLEDSKHEDLRSRVVYWSDDEILAKKSLAMSDVPACLEKKYKKVSRKKSFKNFIGAIVGWKKTKPRRIKSCDDLDEGVKEFRGVVSGLPRAVSLQAVIFKDDNQNDILETRSRSATIRPIYGGKRNQRTLKSFTENVRQTKADSGKDSPESSGNNFSENLVKPSAIKDISRRLSQSFEYPSTEQVSTERRKSIFKGNLHCKSGLVYDVPKSSLPASLVNTHWRTDRTKVQDEYLAILARGANISGYKR